MNLHMALLSQESLTEHLVAVGLMVDLITINGHPNILAHARKPN